MPPEKRDERAPLTDYERYLLKKLSKHPGEWSTEFKADLADYVSVNGSLHVSSMPTLKGEEWRTVDGAGQPAFENSWDGTAQFYRDASGIVRVQGSLTVFGSNGTTAFTLPEGYRPSMSVWFVGATSAAAMQFSVSTAGAVAIWGTPSTFVDLAPISFRAA